MPRKPDADAYAPREKSNSKQMNDAIAHSKRKRTGARDRPKSTDLDYDPAAKRRYDENYDAIFGKKKLPHGR